MVKKFTLLGLWFLAIFVSLAGYAFADAAAPYVPAVIGPQSVLPPVLTVAASGLPPWVAATAGLSYMLLEAWLGSTDLVKSGSVLALVVNGLKTVLGGLSGKDDNKPQSP